MFLIFILGVLAVGLAFLFQIGLALPEWLTMLLLLVIVPGGALGLLRPMKATMIALQYRNRAGEFGSE